jgi:hypothetical protein
MTTTSTLTRSLTCGGEDPVHPTPEAYKVLADKLASMVDDMMAEPATVPASPTPTKKRAAPREPWIISLEPVAKRLIPALSSRGGASSGGGNSYRGSSRGGYHDRGSRGHRGAARGRGGNPRGAGQPAFNKGRGNFAYSGRWPRGRGGY